jgi:ketosteroid isomerase-like protein
MVDVREPDAAEREAILELESRRQRALVDGDLAALDAIFDDRLVHVHAPGLVHDKSKLLEHVGARRAYVDIVRGELDIRMLGDVAVVTGPIVNRLRNPDGSERRQEGVVTQVLRRDAEGVWRFVSFQLTPIGEQVWGRLPSEAKTGGSGEAEA